MQVDKAQTFHRRLEEWFSRNSRSFPWRDSQNLFHVLVAELLLRKTQADRVLPVFNEFQLRYQKPSDVVSGGHDSLMQLLGRLGLQHRVQWLMDLCIEFADQHSDALPRDYDELCKMKGIGSYTASMLLSLGCGEAPPPIDNNIARLVSRVFGVQRVGDTRREKHVAEILEAVFCESNPREITLAMLDLSGALCKASSPKCSPCPLQDICCWNASDLHPTKMIRWCRLPMSGASEGKPKNPNLKRCSAIKERLQQGSFDLGQVTWVDTTKITPFNNSYYNVADLFSGAGGIIAGFAQVGYCPVLTVEVDPVASTTCRHNFPNAIHWEGRVQDVDIPAIRSLLGDRTLHVLVAGFPCPGFSVAGQRDVLDKRNYLYKEVCRFVQEFQPWFVVMENVPGFVSLGGGSYMTALRDDLAEAGYTVSIQVLESASYGVPQLRPRTTIVGNRFRRPNPYPMPVITTEADYVPIETAIDDLKTMTPCPAINHEWTKHSEEMSTRLSRVPAGGSLYSSYVDAWKRQYRGVPSMTVKENHGGTHIHPELDRVLSAREIARLQSFPDSFIFEGTMKRVMFQVGNAVPPLLAKHIATAIGPSLDEIAKGVAVAGNEDLWTARNDNTS